MSGWSNMMNSITGASASAKQQYKNQLALQKDAQNFSKWQMANAHQMEVQDLQNAGLNPVLSAGGQGASAGVSEGSASTGTGQGNPIDMIASLINMNNSSKTTNAEVEKVKADIKNETDKTTAEINNLNTDTLLKSLEIPGAENKSKSDKTLWGKYIRPYIGDAKDMIGSIMGIVNPAVAVSSAKRLSNAIKSPKTTVTNHYNKKGEFTGSTTQTSRK